MPPFAGSAGGAGVLLLVIEGYVVIGNVGEIVGAEVELRRFDLLAARSLGGEVEVSREMSARVAFREFGAVLLAMTVIERRQDDRRAELAFIDEVHRLLVVGVNAGGEAVVEALLDADVVVVCLLCERRGVLIDSRRTGRAREFDESLAA